MKILKILLSCIVVISLSIFMVWNIVFNVSGNSSYSAYADDGIESPPTEEEDIGFVSFTGVVDGSISQSQIYGEVVDDTTSNLAGSITFNFSDISISSSSLIIYYVGQYIFTPFNGTSSVITFYYQLKFGNEIVAIGFFDSSLVLSSFDLIDNDSLVYRDGYDSNSLIDSIGIYLRQVRPSNDGYYDGSWLQILKIDSSLFSYQSYLYDILNNQNQAGYDEGYTAGNSAGYEEGKEEGLELSKYGIFLNCRYNALLTYSGGYQSGGYYDPILSNSSVNFGNLFDWLPKSDGDGYSAQSCKFTLEFAEPFVFSNLSKFYASGYNSVKTMVLITVDGQRVFGSFDYSLGGVFDLGNTTSSYYIKSVEITLDNILESYDKFVLTYAPPDYTSGYTNGYSDASNLQLSDNVFKNPLEVFLQPITNFLNTNIFGSFSIGDGFTIVFFVALALIFIRMFAGG